MREDIITGDWMAGFSTLNDKTAVTEDKQELDSAVKLSWNYSIWRGKMTQTVCNELPFHSLSTKAHLWIVNESEMDEPN